MNLSSEIRAQALALGFDLVRIIPVQPPLHATAFSAWLAAGMQGEMRYLAERREFRLDPASMAPGAPSMIVLAANYSRGPLPLASHDPGHGRVARYAWPDDYHNLMKKHLYALDAFIRGLNGRTTLAKACVDTAPLLERDAALAAGLGFTGKNAMLIAPGLGSWTFLAALLVPEVLDYDAPVEVERMKVAGRPGDEDEKGPAQEE